MACVHLICKNDVSTVVCMGLLLWFLGNSCILQTLFVTPFDAGLTEIFNIEGPNLSLIWFCYWFLFCFCDGSAFCGPWECSERAQVPPSRLLPAAVCFQRPHFADLECSHCCLCHHLGRRGWSQGWSAQCSEYVCSLAVSPSSWLSSAIGPSSWPSLAIGPSSRPSLAINSSSWSSWWGWWDGHTGEWTGWWVQKWWNGHTGEHKSGEMDRPVSAEVMR